MARIENWYKQDLKKPVPIRRMETVFNQDALGHLFGVEVYSDGEAVTLAGSVTGYCLLADGTTVPVSGTRSANRASIVIPQTAYSVIGPITITVKLTEGSAITTLLAVVGVVARSRSGQQVNPGSTITDWTNQIAESLQEVEDASAAQDAKISDLKSAIDYNDNKTDGTLKGIENITDSVLLFDWEHGGIDLSSGETINDGATNRSRDIHYYPVDDVISVTNSSGVAVYLLFYTYSNGTYTFDFAAGVADGSTYTFTTGQHFRIDCRGGFEKARLVTGVAKYKIIKKIEQFENEFGIVNSSVKAISNTLTEEHHETVTAGTMNGYVLVNPILRGTSFTFYNMSSNASMSVIAVKVDGTREVLSNGVGYGYSETFMVDYDIYEIRNYVSNTDWHIKIEYGNTGRESIIYCTIDQSNDLSELQKQTARNNIGAASQSDMAQVKSDLLIDDVTNIYSTTLSNGYIKWSDGTTDSVSNGKYSDYVAVETGDVLTYDLHAVGSAGAVIACYDSSKNYQQSKSVKGTGNGTWQENTGTLTIESGTAFVRFATNSGYSSSDSISLTKHIKLKDYVAEIDQEIVWNGKKWAAFGTSITDTSYIDPLFLMPTGKYVPYLVQMSGMVVTNYGIAGASFLNNIMNKVLSTDLSTFDLVTIEGAVNDHATSKPLGEVGDTSNETFAGTIYQMANYVYTNSNATLIFITDHVGRYVHINPTPSGADFYGDCAPTKRNNLNLLQIDYINMIAKQCEYFGIPIIMAGQDAGINLMTGNQYLVDHIHQSYAGGHQYAQTIWSALKNIKPRIIPDN